MTNRFVCSGITQKTVRFKLQIGDYSKYACKGYYTSPEFGKDECESKWSLLVHVYDGADHQNFIDARLQRHDHVTEVQFVTVKTSIVNCFGLNVLKNEKKILFGGSNETQILAVAKEQLKGLKKNFYLPKDTLTVECDLLIHENSVSSYKKKENFLNNVSQYENNFSEYFAQSRLVKRSEDYFVRKITDFSVQSYGGRTVTPEFESEHFEGKWSLVVCNTVDYNSSECLDIRLVRRESYDHQLVKIKLSIIDPLYNELLSKEKFAYFTSDREVQMLTSTETVISNWFGLRKKQLISDDTLILHCKMVLYEQVDDAFETKKDFDSGMKTSGYAPMLLYPYIVAICFLIPVILHIFYCLCFAVLSFIWHNILDIYEDVKIFLFGVVVIALMFHYVKDKAERIIRRGKKREMRKKLREEQEKIMIERYHEYGVDNYVNNKLCYRRKPNYSNHVNNKFYNSRKPNYSNRRYLN